jgi:hypothetical protein
MQLLKKSNSLEKADIWISNHIHGPTKMPKIIEGGQCLKFFSLNPKMRLVFRYPFVL